MATSEADKDLPTFSLGMVFLTPDKEPREREKKKKKQSTVSSFRNATMALDE